MISAVGLIVQRTDKKKEPAIDDCRFLDEQNFNSQGYSTNSIAIPSCFLHSSVRVTVPAKWYSSGKFALG